MRIPPRLRDLLVVMSLSVLAGCGPAPAPQTDAPASEVQSLAPANFLYRQGKQLYLNGAPYQMVGVNSFPLTGCGAAPTDAQLDTFFATLRPNSLTRTWAFRPFGLARIEKVVLAAEKYNQKLILTLADGRSYCGEWDGYNGSDGSGKQPSWYSTGYQANYLPWVRQLVTRFKDSASIGMWELINEPGDADTATIKAFFNVASTTIKNIDPNHLVSSGSWAPWAYGGEAGFQSLHDLPNIDVGSLHEYDYDYNNGNTIVSPHFAPSVRAMNALNKPLIIGETGINAADSNCRTNRNTRRDAMRAKFQQYLAGGASVVLIWNAQSNNSTACEHTFGPNDPLVPMIKDFPLPEVPTEPPPGGTVQLNDATTGSGLGQFEYLGTWEAGTGTGKFQQDDHFSNTTNASFVVRFSGTQAKLYGSAASHHGIATVSVDSGAPVDVDFYAATRQDQKLLWTSAVLSAGNHTLTVTVSGRKNTASSGFVINADRVDVTTAQGDTTPPTVSITQPSAGTLPVGNVTVDVAASDAGGVARVELWVDGVKLAEDPSSPYAFTWSATAGAHSLVARAVDTAGNVGTSASVAVTVVGQQLVEVQVNDAVEGTGLEQFQYTGTWQAGTGTGKYLEDDHYASATGASYTVRFNGTQAKLYGSAASHHGIATVSLDNGTPVDVDFYAASRQEQKLLWTGPVLTAGNHTLTVTVSGRKNTASSGFVINADRVALTVLR
ncbi:Ig-like domain-containing protein [Myxococcus sp. K38C18041901]|uniref:Ig-like domain-containing protein n=1 Tax=Myxococcus guangdongensis TaxID=2906760 RepID=UPI0020A7DDBF|nr:Ig-like domain-containing protein [Myxococcus guangdongensis]MCP3061227.1 Ig-like domain-containing protein [Myxococcus guangdongensis]